MSISPKGTLACFSLGSNLGDRIRNLEAARMMMEARLGPLHLTSKVYESASWGYSSVHSYYNCCLAVRTLEEPVALLEMALQVERTMGRVRQGNGYADRVIDIDLLLYGDVVMDHPRITLPHPEIAQRKFVLVPLAEIAPDLVHPVLGLPIAVLLARCQDLSVISPV
jgi:2-amino-4-hydroxy-6-hydroxymethyldihydropteridine diphosphokinase